MYLGEGELKPVEMPESAVEETQDTSDPDKVLEQSLQHTQLTETVLLTSLSVL